MDLSFERWSRLSDFERELSAQRLAKELPSGFVFDSIKVFELGEQRNAAVLYRRGSAVFTLIPGRELSLGYDINRRWKPTEDEVESWNDTAQEYGIEETLEEHVAQATLRPRRIEVRPMLVEAVATEVGWEAISVEDPEVQDMLRNHQSHKPVTVHDGGTITRVCRSKDGSVIAERALSSTHADLVARNKAAGFRLPTSDEWEYLCGAGAPTLFRWGDHVPVDRYPTDISPAEADWRRQWVLSGGTLEYPPEGFASDWDYHRRPNAHGLSIAFDPYKSELVAEIGTTRGGDGGCTICGGAGFFVGWLTLATAYFEEHACRHEPSESISVGYTVARRVLELR